MLHKPVADLQTSRQEEHRGHSASEPRSLLADAGPPTGPHTVARASNSVPLTLSPQRGQIAGLGAAAERDSQQREPAAFHFDGPCGPLPGANQDWLDRYGSGQSQRKRRNSDEEHQKRDEESAATAQSPVASSRLAVSSLVRAQPRDEVDRASREAHRSEGDRAAREAERRRREIAAAHAGRVDNSSLQRDHGDFVAPMTYRTPARLLDRLSKFSRESQQPVQTIIARAPETSDLEPGSSKATNSTGSALIDEKDLKKAEPTQVAGENGDTADEDIEEYDSEEDLEDVAGFDAEDEDEEDMHANGVPAARGWRLDARKSKTATFRATVLAMFSRELELDTWSRATVNPKILPLTSDRIKLKRISGAFSNAVFFVSYDTDGLEEQGPRTVLLRVYGSGTEVLLSRRAELLILHTLSSLYEIGPHILGTFANGRVETFFDAAPIGKEGVRDLGDRMESLQEDGSLLVRGKEGRAQWVARRMRQLHEVPLDVMKRVLEQGDLRSVSESSTVFGQGIETHLFARSHRPRIARGPMQGPAVLDNSRRIAESPAPLAEEDAEEAEDTSMVTSGADGARAQRMHDRDHAAQRNSSVASFDSLATSFNSIDAPSIGSLSTEGVKSPKLAASSYFDSYSLGSNRGRRRRSSAAAMNGARRQSTSANAHFRPSQPYPGMWRRSKRWAREAGKVFAIVEDFCQTAAGKAAYAKALKGTSLEKAEYSPFTTGMLPDTKSTEIGTTNDNLRNTLLTIAAIDFPRLLLEMDAFKGFVRKWERRHGSSRRVLAHGDTQYSNLLLIKEDSLEDAAFGKGMPRAQSRDMLKAESGSGKELSMSSRSRSRRLAPFERLIVIDFEYCSPNPRAYDIANAFHEWRFDYHHPTDSWSPYICSYPTRDEQRRWLRAYVEQGRLLRMRGQSSKASGESPSGGSAVAQQAPPDDLALPPPAVAGKSHDGNAVARRPEPKPKQPSRDKSADSSGSASSASAIPQHASPATLKAFSGADASPSLAPRTTLVELEASMEREMDRLQREIEVFSPACHASWALWGVTFAKENIESVLTAAYDQIAKDEDEPDLGLSRSVDNSLTVAADTSSAEGYDNLRYALGRVELFRAELAALGISV